MEFNAETIAHIVGGVVIGDPQTTVNDFAKIEDGKEGCISFLANPKYEEYIYTTCSSIVLVNNTFEARHPVRPTLICVADAYQAMAQLMQAYDAMNHKPTGISPLAYVAPSARIGKDCSIAPFAYVGDGVEIGDYTIVKPHVTIYHDCRIGARCILHAGCVIGADGFGFARTPKGYEKIPQLGNVVIEDDVEIGANSCVDRATLGSTFIRKGVKLDNLVQIAHNDDIGAHTVMSAQVGIAGSTKIGEWCMFGGQAGVGGHASVADHTLAGGRCGITNSIRKGGQRLMGMPAIEETRYWKANVALKNLPDTLHEIAAMRREINELKTNINAWKNSQP